MLKLGPWITEIAILGYALVVCVWLIKRNINILYMATVDVEENLPAPV